MNLKSAIDTLRTELRKFTTQKQAFADYKLADGTVIRVDGDLVAGTPVYVITEDETLPAPDGEHEVEGVGVVKTEGGKTTVTWAMYGKNEGLLAKVMSLIMDCESMCGPEFEKGLAEVAKLATAPAVAPAAP